MFQIALLALVGLGMAAFMVNRLYVLFTQKLITVKGVTYTREGWPVTYWVMAAGATIGLLAGSTIFILAAWALSLGAGR